VAVGPAGWTGLALRTGVGAGTYAGVKYAMDGENYREQYFQDAASGVGEVLGGALVGRVFKVKKGLITPARNELAQAASDATTHLATFKTRSATVSGVESYATSAMEKANAQLQRYAAEKIDNAGVAQAAKILETKMNDFATGVNTTKTRWGGWREDPTQKALRTDVIEATNNLNKAVSAAKAAEKALINNGVGARIVKGTAGGVVPGGIEGVNSAETDRGLAEFGKQVGGEVGETVGQGAVAGATLPWAWNLVTWPVRKVGSWFK
jgi:vacuolar-type H+-ATPase subunit E/Vma4